MAAGFGRLKVTERVVGFERKRTHGLEVVDRQPLDLPPVEYETQGLWLRAPRAAAAELEATGGRLLGALHAVEHAARLGMDVVILDHHRITEPPPHQAIVASAQLAEGSPYAGISAAGVAYLLATALAGAGCVVAVGSGTLCDIGKKATEGPPTTPYIVVQTACSVNAFSDDMAVLLLHGAKRTVPSRTAKSQSESSLASRRP